MWFDICGRRSSSTKCWSAKKEIRIIIITLYQSHLLTLQSINHNFFLAQNTVSLNKIHTLSRIVVFVGFFQATSMFEIDEQNYFENFDCANDCQHDDHFKTVHINRRRGVQDDIVVDWACWVDFFWCCCTHFEFFVSNTLDWIDFNFILMR